MNKENPSLPKNGVNYKEQHAKLLKRKDIVKKNKNK